MNALRILIICSLTLSTLSCEDAADKRNPPAVNVKREIGDRAVQILRGATRVEAFKIHRGPTTRPVPDFEGYIIDAKANEQGKEFAARLSSVLLDDYMYASAYIECFDPGIAYRVWKDKERVDVLICFHCKHVLINGKMLNFNNDRGEPALQKLVDESFPNDAKDKKPAP